MNNVNINELSLVIDSKIYDLTDLIISVNVYESLFDNYTTANITINDSLGLLEELQLQGDEKIKLSFSGSDISDMEFHTKNYDIIAIKNVDEVIGKPSKMYTIECATEILNKSLETNLQISYYDKESNIVKQIIEDNLNLKVDVEESSNESIYIFKNESPLDVFNNLSKFAQTSLGLQSASYYFYEDRVNYNFKSLEFLINKKSPYKTFTQKIKSNINDIDFFSVKNFSINNVFDVGTLSISGGFGSDTYEIDLINKKVNNVTYTTNELFTNSKHIDSNSNKIKNKKIDKTRNIIKSYTNIEIKNRAKQFVTRAYLESIFENISVTAEMFGNTNLTVGNIANVDIQSNMINVTKEQNKYFSGNYLIAGVRHEFTKANFNTFLELIKPTMMTKT